MSKCGKKNQLNIVAINNRFKRKPQNQLIGRSHNSVLRNYACSCSIKLSSSSLSVSLELKAVCNTKLDVTSSWFHAVNKGHVY